MTTKHPDYDPHEPCRRTIAVLERQLQKHDWPEIAMVIVSEGDQYGTWDRVAKVTNIYRTTEGLVIRVI